MDPSSLKVTRVLQRPDEEWLGHTDRDLIVGIWFGPITGSERLGVRSPTADKHSFRLKIADTGKISRISSFCRF